MTSQFNCYCCNTPGRTTSRGEIVHSHLCNDRGVLKSVACNGKFKGHMNGLKLSKLLSPYVSKQVKPSTDPIDKPSQQSIQTGKLRSNTKESGKALPKIKMRTSRVSQSFDDRPYGNDSVIEGTDGSDMMDNKTIKKGIGRKVFFRPPRRKLDGETDEGESNSQILTTEKLATYAFCPTGYSRNNLNISKLKGIELLNQTPGASIGTSELREGGNTMETIFPTANTVNTKMGSERSRRNSKRLDRKLLLQEKSHTEVGKNERLEDAGNGKIYPESPKATVQMSNIDKQMQTEANLIALQHEDPSNLENLDHRGTNWQKRGTIQSDPNNLIQRFGDEKEKAPNALEDGAGKKRTLLRYSIGAGPLVPLNAYDPKRRSPSIPEIQVQEPLKLPELGNATKRDNPPNTLRIRTQGNSTDRPTRAIIPEARSVGRSFDNSANGNGADKPPQSHRSRHSNQLQNIDMYSQRRTGRSSNKPKYSLGEQSNDINDVLKNMTRTVEDTKSMSSRVHYPDSEEYFVRKNAGPSGPLPQLDRVKIVEEWMRNEKRRRSECFSEAGKAEVSLECSKFEEFFRLDFKGNEKSAPQVTQTKKGIKDYADSPSQRILFREGSLTPSLEAVQEIEFQQAGVMPSLETQNGIGVHPLEGTNLMESFGKTPEPISMRNINDIFLYSIKC